MYEVLTGRVPFDDVENTFYLVTLIQKGERPPIPDCGRYASSPIWEVVARCWAPTPDQRPTMEEVVEALKEIPSPPPDRSAPERRLPIPFPQYDDHEMLKTSPSPRRHLHLPSLSLSSIFRTTWSSAGTVKLSDGTTVVLKSMAPSVFSSTCDILIGTVRSTETLVALKRLRVSQTNASTRKEVEQIENECRLWKDLHHPNILQFMGVGKDDKGNQYLVSRWMKNGSLWKHIKTHPDDHCDRSRYLREVAEALVYLHDEKQMVHGDIRASNIIISDTLHALLCDFGRSRPINEEPFESWSGETRNWQSPELLEGGKVTFASDVYAFGMTIYQVLSGKEPFYEYDQASILHAVIIDNDRPQKEPSMLSTDEDYSRLWMIAERCWKRNPEERPSMSTVLRWMEGQNLSELEMP
ncbi:hypothetical protein FRB99_006819 [Tulasnella sp. 403]|nr:hypothetical protein FRB99_006819 [Tulasnella sp. 403]